jgi:hypothetical protein
MDSVIAEYSPCPMPATEVIGVYEVLTCPFEAPPNFKPIMEPEFSWQSLSNSR